MTKVIIPDMAERRIIEEQLDTNLFVEAGAGSGKTYSLVRRILALFAGGLAEPCEVAAITFTRKAAAELRQRMQERLEEVVRQETDPLIRGRMEAARHRLGEAFVGTIHSFCARLLREHPFEAGLDPEFRELEEGDVGRFDRESWQMYLERYQAEHPEFIGMLEEMDLKASDLEEIFHRLAQYPEAVPYWEERPAPVPAAIEAQTRELLRALRERFPSRKPDRGWDPVQQAVLDCQRLLGSAGPGGPRRFRLVVEDLMKVNSGQITQNRWADKSAGKEAGALLDVYQNDAGGPWLSAWHEHCHGRIMPVVWPAVAYAADRRRGTGVVGFTDLLQGATALLRDHPLVRRRLAGQYRRLFVDEFQDTDPIQAEMMFLLTGEPADEPDWRRVVPAPGSLFVVGDPKQSIYRFRRADIATYQEVKERIVATGGRVVRLTASFRSLPAVAGWVNRAFGEILPAQGHDYQAAFAPLEAVRSDDAYGETMAGVFRITLPAVKWHGAGEIVRMDAERIAAWIAWACAGNLGLDRTEDELRSGLTLSAQPGDFLILLPVKQHIGVYAGALERVGLPAAISGGDILGESDHLRWFLQMCDAVADPEDPVKLLACLRGPLLGVSDAELFRFKIAGGRFSYLHVPDSPSETTQPVVEALALLNRFWRRTRQQPALVAMEGMIEELGLIPLAAASPNGRIGVGAIVQALETLRAAPDEGIASFAGAVARLHAMAEAGEGEAADVKPALMSAVRLMNLHKAKGLEAPVVFLAAPARQKEHPVETHVDRRHSPIRSYYRVRGAARLVGQPPGWEGAAREEGQFVRCEKDRLLYVAATRARNILVVSRYAGNTEADLWARLHPWASEAQELPDGEAALKERPRVDIHPGEIQLEMQRLEVQRSKSVVPGYEHLAVTALAKRAAPAGADEVAPAAEDVLSGMGQWAAPEPPLEGSLHGAGWGTAVHRLFEAVFRGLPRERWHGEGRWILAEEGLPAEALEELVGLAVRAWESPLGLRIRQALEVHTEVPFGMAASRAELGLGDDGPETVLLEGAMDLVFREADGWVIVDYKTDMGALGNAAEVVETYAPQIRMYGRFWRERMGETVKEMVVWLMRTMEAVGVEE